MGCRVWLIYIDGLLCLVFFFCLISSNRWEVKWVATIALGAAVLATGSRTVPGVGVPRVVDEVEKVRVYCPPLSEWEGIRLVLSLNSCAQVSELPPWSLNKDWGRVKIVAWGSRLHSINMMKSSHLGHFFSPPSRSFLLPLWRTRPRCQGLWTDRGR